MSVGRMSRECTNGLIADNAGKFMVNFTPLQALSLLSFGSEAKVGTTEWKAMLG